MTARGEEEGAPFDAYATGYEAALARGLVLAGEPASYFAAGRARVVAGLLRRRARPAGRVLDFGCGIGGSLPWLRGLPGILTLSASDPSLASMARAREVDAGVHCLPLEGLEAGAPFDLIWVTGVFHHIPPSERAAVVRRLSGLMASGGWLTIWENNPWNPGARWVMRRIPFDRDAVMLSVLEVRRLARQAGLVVVDQRFAFVFPAFLRAMRWIEAAISALPLGAQYLVVAEKA